MEKERCQRNPSRVTYLSNIADYAAGFYYSSIILELLELSVRNHEGIADIGRYQELVGKMIFKIIHLFVPTWTANR